MKESKRPMEVSMCSLYSYHRRENISFSIHEQNDLNFY